MGKKFSGVSQTLSRFRGWIQAGATLLTNLHLPNFLKGGLYQGAGKTVCVPGLNCYSCPAASGACPIGAFQAVVGSSKFRFSYYITGILILLGVLLGRFICGFLCPFGWLQELLHKIPGKKMPWRLYDENGQAQCDLIAMDGEVIEAGKPVTMVNLDSDAIERTITFIPTAVRPLLVPHILGGELAIELPSIAEKKAYIAKQLTEETWESELRLECPHKHYVNMTPAVAECRSRMYAELHGGKV